MTRARLIAATLTGAALLCTPTVASATPTGTYQTTTRTVSCAWVPSTDLVMCATSRMAQRGAYVQLSSLDRAERSDGEVIRGGRRMRSGRKLDGATSIVCTFGRISIRCVNDLSGHGFKLGRGYFRVW